MNAYNRKLLAVYMDWLVYATNKIGYHQQRPMVTSGIDSAKKLHDRLAQGISIDCSESLTLLCHLAGLRPPSGDIDGWTYGNTSTILNNLPHLGGAAQAKLGDIAIFNADRPLSEQHGVMVRVPGDNPKLFSHGQPDDPAYWRLSQLQPGFQGHTVFLSIGRL